MRKNPKHKTIKKLAYKFEETETLHVRKNPHKGRMNFWKVYDDFAIARGTKWEQRFQVE